MLNKIARIVLLLCVASVGLRAQVTLSPFSRYGIGDIFDASSTRIFSMGGMGVANYDHSSVNRLNPASYADIRLTTLDFSTFGSYHNQKSDSSTFTTGNGGFQNLSFAFSNKKNWGLVFGLAPYSSTGYTIVTNQQVLVDTTLESSVLTYKADGGLNQFYIGYGIRVFRGLNVGTNLSYAFGNTTFDWTNNFTNAAYQTANIQKRVRLSGLIPQLGLQYGDTLTFRSETDRLKELEKEYEGMDDELAQIAKEKVALEKEKAKFDQKKVKLEAKKAVLVTEKDAANAQVATLMENEKDNRKEIGKYQEKAFRIEKKRKKLDRFMKVEDRKLQADLNRLDGRASKVRSRQETNLATQEQVRTGKVAATGLKENKFTFRLGATLDVPVKLKGERLLKFNNGAFYDTLGTVTAGSVNLPLRYAGGFTFGKPFKWMVGADVSLQDWSQFAYFDEPNTLKSTMRISAGGEFIPKLTSPKFFQRTAYRIGGYYQDTYLQLDGAPVKEFGVTAGVGLPMGFFNPVGLSYSRLNIGLSYGVRGNLSQNPLEESVISLRLGVNLNDVWFRKRVVD